MKALLIWNPAIVGESNTAKAVINAINSAAAMSLLTTDIEVSMSKGAVEVDGVQSQEQCDELVGRAIALIKDVREALPVTLTTSYTSG